MNIINFIKVLETTGSKINKESFLNTFGWNKVGDNLYINEKSNDEYPSFEDDIINIIFNKHFK